MKTHLQIAQTILKQNNESPRLGIMFNDVDRYFPQMAEVSFYYHFKAPLKLLTPNVTTPLRFENWLFRTVERTVFKDYIVEDKRYGFSFSGLPKDAVKKLFYSVLKGTGTKSWLAPLQELLLAQPTNQKRRGRTTIIDMADHDPAIGWGVDDANEENKPLKKLLKPKANILKYTFQAYLQDVAVKPPAVDDVVGQI